MSSYDPDAEAKELSRRTCLQNAHFCDLVFAAVSEEEKLKRSAFILPSAKDKIAGGPGGKFVCYVRANGKFVMSYRSDVELAKHMVECATDDKLKLGWLPIVKKKNLLEESRDKSIAKILLE